GGPPRRRPSAPTTTSAGAARARRRSRPTSARDALARGRRHGRLELLGGHAAVVLGDDRAGGIDEERLRHALHPVLDRRAVGAAGDHGPVAALLGEELPHAVELVAVVGDADDLDLAAVALGERDQLGVLLDARRAPR